MKLIENGEGVIKGPGIGWVGGDPRGWGEGGGRVGCARAVN